MTGRCIDRATGTDTRSPNHQWDIDIFFEALLLSALQSVLAQVVSIVRGVDDIGLARDAFLIKLLNETFYHDVHRLQRALPVAIVLIQETDILLPEALKTPDMIHATPVRGIKIEGVSGHTKVTIEVCVFVFWDWEIGCYVRSCGLVWSDRCGHDEERLTSLHCSVDVMQCPLSNVFGAVSWNRLGWVVIRLLLMVEERIIVGIHSRIEKQILRTRVSVSIHGISLRNLVIFTASVNPPGHFGVQ